MPSLSGVHRQKSHYESGSGILLYRPVYQPISDLDLMIADGWGDTPQHKLPPDWKTRKKPTVQKKGPNRVQAQL